MSKLSRYLTNPFYTACLLGISIFLVVMREISFPFFTSKTETLFGISTIFPILLFGLSIVSIIYSARKYNADSDQITKIRNQIILPLLVVSSIMLLSNWSFLKFGYLPHHHIVPASILLILFINIYSDRAVYSESFLWLVGLIVTFYSCFLLLTDFNPLFTDDHGSVIYRLTLLKQNFPFIPLYNAEWNAGMDWRDFFATGILNVFLLFSPLIYGLSINDAYALIVPLILFVVLPFSSYFGARYLGVDRLGANLSALCSLSCSSIWYRWALSYGSLGFVCSTAILPLSFCLLLYCLHREKEVRWFDVILCILSSTLAIFWSAQGITLLMVVLAYLLKYRIILGNKKLITLVLSLLLINGPWIVGFLNISKVGSFVKSDTGHETVEEELDDIVTLNKSVNKMENVRIASNKINMTILIKRIRDFATKLNPIILYFFLPALFLARIPQFYLNVFLATSCFLVTLGLIGPSFKPQLELERLLLVLSILGCIPVGSLLSSFILSQHEMSKIYKILGKFCLSLLLAISVFSVFNVIQNKSYYSYKTWPIEMDQLAQTLKQNSQGGRALFAGFVLHELGGGHIASLTTLSQVPIIAASPVHNLWWYTDVIPAYYRKLSAEGIEQYLDLMNVSQIVAHESNWKNYFRSSPLQYEEVAIVDRFVVFKRIKYPDSYFMEGAGKVVEQNSSGVLLDLETEMAVLRYNYYPFLQVDGCSNIEPVERPGEVRLIKISGCKRGQVSINSKSLWGRILS